MGVALKYYGFDAASGKSVLKEKEVDVKVYKDAADNKMTLRQWMRRVAPDYDASQGDVIDQMMSQAALLDGRQGHGPAITMKEMSAMTLADGFRKPDGSNNSLGARLLYPQVILETLQANAHTDDGSDILNIWETMIATSRNIVGTKAEQPIIDTRGPEGSRSARISQLAEPATMISITTGQKSYRIPTNSVGLLISDEAMEATTIDLVRVVMEAQARGDKIARVGEQLRAMVLGDIDQGMEALPTVLAKSFDSAITANGQITKKAYIKWLYSKHNRFNLNRALGDIDTAFVLDEALTPIVGGPNGSKIATPWGGLNLNLTQPDYVPFDTDVFGANTLVALDTRYAIQRFVNVSASYDAIEEYVMRKATGFRVDYGEMSTRLHDDAWSVLSLTV